jgi:restriction system protein
MPIPDFQTLMLPVLQQYADGQTRKSRDVREAIGQALKLSAAEIEERLPSGRQTRFVNRVAWTHSYLKQAGLIDAAGRGVYRLTDRGREVLKLPPPRIDIHYLEQYPEFLAFRSRSEGPASPSVGEVALEGITKGLLVTADGVSLTPDEQVRTGA